MLKPIVTPPTTATIDFPNLTGIPGQSITTGGAPVGLGGTTPVFAPGSVGSPYYFAQVQSQAGNVTLGADVAQIMGLDPAKTYNMHDLLAYFNQLSLSQLMQIQSMLADGGFYVNSDGTPMTTPPSLGARDNQSFIAFANLVMQSSQTGRSATDVLNANVYQGLGITNRMQGIQPQVGGANAYQIDLTNPTDIAYTARGIFRAALGRGPTQAELDRVEGAVRSGQIAAGQAWVGTQEKSQQQQFQAGLAARQAQAAPRLALGPVPDGPFKNMGEWAAAFLDYLGGGTQKLVTASNLSMIMGWANATGMGLKSNNPLGSTLPAPGSSQTAGGPYPSAQNYAHPADGMRAAAQTLGNFPIILNALLGGNAAAVVDQKALQDELGQWSNGAFTNITKQVGGAQKTAATAAKAYGTQPAAPGAPGAAGAAAPGGASDLAGWKMGAPNPAFEGPMSAFGAATTPTGPSAFQGPMANLGGEVTGAPGVPPGPNEPNATTDATTNSAVVATLDEGAHNQAVGAYLTAQYDAAHGIPSTQSPQTLYGQQPLAPGTTYLPPNVLENVQAPSPESAAWQQATTGANQIPYLAYQYLNAFNAIMDMVNSGGRITGSMT
jgi:hypothetical protein